MAQLIVMYKTQRDAAAFDKHYAEKHVPLEKRSRASKNTRSAKVPLRHPAARPAITWSPFSSSTISPPSKEGSAAPKVRPQLADVQTFATGGVD